MFQQNTLAGPRLSRVASALLLMVVLASSARAQGRDMEEAERLQLEFPDCRVHSSEHYLMVSDVAANTSDSIKQLLERVHEQYLKFWNDLDWSLDDAHSRLIVVVVSDPLRFQEFQVKELGEKSGAISAFYGRVSNRIVVYLDPIPPVAVYSKSSTDLVPPYSESFARNLVHEATHQLLLNTGVQNRQAVNPLWLSEGLATLFEAIDASDTLLWRHPGGDNPIRSMELRHRLPIAPAELEQMIESDQPFRHPETSLQSYALAWGFTSFLVRQHPQALVAYLKELKRTDDADVDDAERRRELFQQSFGDDFAAIARRFSRFASKLH